MIRTGSTSHRIRCAALHNGDLVRFTVEQLTSVVAKRAMFVGALVYAFGRDGSTGTGIASTVLLIASVATAPYAGAVVRTRPNRVRVASFAIEGVAFAAASASAFASAPTFVVIAPCVVAVAVSTFNRPAAAMIMPAIVRTSRELTVANVWIGYGDAVSVLGAALLATALLALQGPALVLTGCAAFVLASFAIAMTHVHIEPPPPHAEPETPTGPLRLTVHSLAVMAKLPGTAGVLAVTAGLAVFTGSLDLVLVVLAGDALDLGRAGAGVLSTLVGIGALLSIPVSTALVRRTRLAPVLVAGLAVIAAGTTVLGALVTLPAAVVVLPIIGCSVVVLSLASRMLLQRSVPPAALGATFGVLELLPGIGKVVGAIVIQVLIAVADVEAALFALGAIFLVLLVASRHQLQSADTYADVPVVAMSLLRRIPEFAPLPTASLEAVAREAAELQVDAGEIIIHEGAQGDRFFAVADGRFDVTIAGGFVRTLDRGDGFGEIALLADVPRTATLTARDGGLLLAIEREAFLVAVTGSEPSRAAAWRAIRSLQLTAELRAAIPD